MTCVAIIPARGGSRGIPDKNLQKVGGKTLVHRTIEHAMASKRIDRVIVSSDSSIILLHAKLCGAEILERPLYLATDEAGGDELLVHVLSEIGCTEETAGHLTVFLQPTSPLRPAGLIDECIERMEGGYDSVFTVTEGHFVWKRVAEGADVRLVPAVGSMDTRKMRQRLTIFEKPYIENGAVYVSRTDALLRAKNRVCGKIGIVVMEEEDAIDIDTPYHLWLANARAQYLSENEATKELRYVVGERGLVAAE